MVEINDGDIVYVYNVETNEEHILEYYDHDNQKNKFKQLMFMLDIKKKNMTVAKIGNVYNTINLNVILQKIKMTNRHTLYTIQELSNVFNNDEFYNACE